MGYYCSMITLRELDEADLRQTIRDGEFTKEIRGSAPYVVIILSQGWCGEWKILYARLKKVSGWDQSHRPDIDIRWALYDRLPCMKEFMEFKETIWNNDLIPYLRYYGDGELIATSNFVMEKELFSILGV